MARWYLTAAHYLAVPGTEWTYMETDRQTGRAKNKKFTVPLHLDPNDPGVCNYKAGIPNAEKKYTKNLSTDDPFIVVAYENDHAQGPDIIFVGPPTPDMVPIDDEAAALTEQMKPYWIHPINDLPIQGGASTYTESILSNLQNDIDELQKANQSPREQIQNEALLELMRKQQETNENLMAILAALVPPAKSPERRV